MRWAQPRFRRVQLYKPFRLRYNELVFANKIGMKKESWFLAVLILIILFLIAWQPRQGWPLQRFFLVNLNDFPEDYVALKSENIKLKAERAQFEHIQNQLPQKPENYLRALVYSRYPFNFKNKMLINVGAADGVQIGQPVLFGDFLIGRVEQVFGYSALVTTLFDQRWQSAVIIGERAEDALLVGGNQPLLTLIDKNAMVETGDAVYNGAPDFPYGIPIAEIRRISSSGNQLWQEAQLVFPYDLNDVRTVLLVQDHDVERINATRP